ncbi:hypothetical protein FACS1894187_13050 [Synergistales bacterium]|nr:hypothetical protein FACS1894187_13050 [Synergistales bacterium]
MSMAAKLRIESYEGTAGKIVLARIMRHTDLVSGVIAICRKHGLKMAAIEIAIGSLISASLSWTRASEKTLRGSERTPIVQIDGPLEFIAGQGFVCLCDKKPVVHLHGSLCDGEGRVWAGHFFEGGNPVHSTMDVWVQELCGVRMDWVHDDEIDLELPVPRPDPS